MDNNMEKWVAKAIEGDREALEYILTDIRDFVFNLSLRMLGTVADAEDATQDILVKIMTSLSTFRQESQFKTWVYRVATNYLIDYKKSMFAQHPLDFDFYANDIRAGFMDSNEELFMGVDKKVLAEELKMSCTNVMLQCLDAPTRCIFILGTMFGVDSKMAGEILGMTPANYRQKLSRARRKMAAFLSEHCGLSGGYCNCEKRVGYAIKQHRLHPEKLEFKTLKQLDHAVLVSCMESMEEIDELSTVFEELPKYRSSLEVKRFLELLLESKQLKEVQHY